MRIIFFSTRDYERPYLEAANKGIHELRFTELALSEETIKMAMDFDAVSVFTSDKLTADLVSHLHSHSVKFIAVRATGYDNVDVLQANEESIRVANVPHYSPQSIAEHATALMLALSRKLVLADRQVHRYDFTLSSLIGFTLHGKTAGVIGTGQTGAAMVSILHGFGCNILAYDVQPDPELTDSCNVTYTTLEDLCARADIISIHAPLNLQTAYLINRDLLSSMKDGVMLINTARGAILNTADLVEFLENGKVAYFGMDVYEHEKGIFFQDWSESGLQDELLKKLMAYPNVLITPHQAFATREALEMIAQVTIDNITSWDETGESLNDIIVVPKGELESIY